MNPDPSDGALLIKFFGALLVALNIASLAVGLLRRPSDKREITPQPLEIVAGDQALPRREWLLAKESLDAEIGRLGREQSTIRGELSEVKSLVAAMQATADAQSQALAQVAAKLDRMIERQTTTTPHA